MTRYLIIPVSLLAGLLVYWFLSPGIFLFRLIALENNDPVTVSDDFLVAVRNYLPDILWATALNQTALLLKEKIGKIDFCIIILLPFASEIFQLFEFIPGYFDWVDLGLYALLLIIFLKLKYKVYEAKN